MAVRWTFTSLVDWLSGYRIGFVDLWRSNSPGFALRLFTYNLLGIKRVFRAQLYGFEVSLRSGTPDLLVAMESLGRELEPVTSCYGKHEAALIIDAGGYIGTAAMKLARSYPECQIVCLEPSSENLALLRINVATYPNIKVVQAALAATESQVTLRYPGRKQWGFTIIAESDDSDHAIESVKTTTIDKILVDENRDRLFILKLDIEGAEAEIFGNSDGWIARTDIIIAELHEWLMPGAEAAFHTATEGRQNRFMPGEKVVSLRPGFATA